MLTLRNLDVRILNWCEMHCDDVVQPNFSRSPTTCDQKHQRTHSLSHDTVKTSHMKLVTVISLTVQPASVFRLLLLVPSTRTN